MNNQIATMPDANADAQPKAIDVNASGEAAPSSGSIRAAAPRIAMMPNMNENSAAATGATPNAKATATVDPLRETPGRIAKACATPMYAAAFQVGSLWVAVANVLRP